MNSKKLTPGKLIIYIILSLGAFIMVLPFLWTVLSSLKDMKQTFAVPPTIFPDPVIWENYPCRRCLSEEHTLTVFTLPCL